MTRTPMHVLTRIPESRAVVGLHYGAHISGPGWSGYHVTLPDGRTVIARTTPTDDELYETDVEIVAAIAAELDAQG